MHLCSYYSLREQAFGNYKGKTKVTQVFVEFTRDHYLQNDKKKTFTVVLFQINSSSIILSKKRVRKNHSILKYFTHS